jgi:hypothetical protein
MEESESAGREGVGDECARVLGCSGNHSYFVLRNLRLAYRERRSQAGLGQLCCWPTFGSREGLRIATQAALMTSIGARLNKRLVGSNGSC